MSPADDARIANVQSLSVSKDRFHSTPLPEERKAKRLPGVRESARGTWRTVRIPCGISTVTSS